MLTKLKALRNQAGEEGFTLIELLVVIIIIGILSAIALPLFFNQQKEGIKAGVKSDVRNTVTNVATHLVKYPTDADLASATGDAAVTVVKSAETTAVTVNGPWNNYVVSGRAASADNFVYTFYSNGTNGGKYVESTGTTTVTTPPTLS